MIRILRLLPVIIPIARRILRNPSVRSRLGMKPLPDEGRGGRR